MIPKLIFQDNLHLVHSSPLPTGDIVECGVWKGGMSKAISDKLKGDNRRIHLFDSFEGLPQAKEIDGISAIEYQENTDSIYYFDNCSADMQYAESLFRESKQDYRIYKGWFSETLKNIELKGDGIALLRLDADWYEPTIECLDFFAPHLKDGALVIIDDYYTWDGCAKAVHEFLAKTMTSTRILSTDRKTAHFFYRI